MTTLRSYSIHRRPFLPLLARPFLSFLFLFFPCFVVVFNIIPRRRSSSSLHSFKAILFGCSKSLSFVELLLCTFLCHYLFSSHPGHQAPITGIPPQPLRLPRFTEANQHYHSHSLSILRAVLASHGPLRGCCCGDPFLRLDNLGPRAIKQSSWERGVRWNTMWGGQCVSGVKPLLLA